eukprot:724185-Pyramimonas_sp.AAC.1
MAASRPDLSCRESCPCPGYSVDGKKGDGVLLAYCNITSWSKIAKDFASEVRCSAHQIAAACFSWCQARDCRNGLGAVSYTHLRAHETGAYH